MTGADNTYALTPKGEAPEDEEQAQSPCVAEPTLVPSTRHWRIGASVGALGVLLVIAACVNQGIPRAQPNAPNKSKDLDATMAQVRNVVEFYRASPQNTLGSAVDALADEIQEEVVPEVAAETGEDAAEAANFGQESESDSCLALKKEEDLDFDDGRLEVLKEKFQTLDADGSGCLNTDEVMAMMNEEAPPGFTATTQMAENAVKMADVCVPHGCIGPVEYLNQMEHPHHQEGGEPPPVPSCDGMWSIMNTGAPADDYVTTDEIKNFMPPGTGNTGGMSLDDMVGMLVLFNDKDGDGKLNRDEFGPAFCALTS